MINIRGLALANPLFLCLPKGTKANKCMDKSSLILLTSKGTETIVQTIGKTRINRF